MVNIQNEEVQKAYQEQLRISIAEGMLRGASDGLVPVLDVTPHFHRRGTVYRGQSTSTGTITVYNGSAKKRLVVTGYSLSIIKDATCDLASGVQEVIATQGGTSQRLAGYSSLVTTAQQVHITQSFKEPVFLDENTNVTFAGTFTVGAYVRLVLLYGYEVDVT